MLTALLATGVAASGQVATTAQPRPPVASATATAVPVVDPVLTQLSQTVQSTQSDIGRLQIVRWKTNADNRQQAINNAESITRNLREAMPGLILSAQSAPADLGPTFKLYRNLNALYDVLANLTESAGAFGRDDDYNALVRDAQQIDAIRHQLADRLESMTVQRDQDMARMRQAQQAAQAAAAAAPPKKIVIDDSEPAPKKKATRKKPAQKPPEGSPH